MNDSNPPIEAQRFGRSQTPESPRPVHIPEPSNIPVLQNQMDPVFNDTATYNIRPSSHDLATSPANAISNEAEDAVSNLSRNATGDNPRTEDDSHFDTGIERLFANDSAHSSQAFLSSSSAHANVASAPPSSFYTSQPAEVDASHAQLEPKSEQAQDASSLPAHTFTSHSQQPSLEQNGQSSTDLHPVQQSHPVYTQPSAGLTSGSDSNAPGFQGGGVDYQLLLDRVSQSVSTAPTAGNVTVTTTAATHNEGLLTDKGLPQVAGLPPKPPPQVRQNNIQEYSPETQRYFAQPPQISTTSLGSTYNSQPPSAAADSSGFAGANRLPPPPLSGGHQPAFQNFRPSENAPGELSRASSSAERPWSADTQAIFDQFLEDERSYVTEGVWDKFPIGSRLFVGNLPTEKVTKRDLFHVFHRHGRLAQISIKQAYGFVQFLEAEACHNALVAEQSVEIRGRKIHLEVSKPQRNTRPAGGSGNKSAVRRRSRSPDRGAARDRLTYSDYRDEPGRRREDYRSVRSPSPRGYRSRDEYRPREGSPRTYKSYDARPKSPPFGNSYRPLSPPDFDDDAALPLPRRSGQDVPDVQLLVLEEIAPQFVNYVEQGFRQKGLKAQTIWLNPRLTLAAVVNRQIREGVHAVVKLTRSNQFNSKIPLQVFDRVPGTTHINFNEYVDLDIPVAADLVVVQQQKERAAPQGLPFPQYPPSQPFPAQPQYNYPQQPQIPQPYNQAPTQPYAQLPLQYQPPLAQQPAPQPQYRPPSQSSATPNSAAPNLQELLANLRQPSTAPQPQHSPLTPQNNRPTDLAGLLSNVAARQYNHSQPYGQNGHYSSNPPTQAYPNQAQQPGYGAQQTPQNLQNTLNQLNQWTR